MGGTLKQGASKAKLQNLAHGVSSPVQSENKETTPAMIPKNKASGEVLIGASFPRIVRRSISLLMADPRNDGKTIKDLLAEALNDLFAKYGLPETAKVHGGSSVEKSDSN